MKIAIPTRNNSLDNHFGHCEYFTLIEVDSSKKVLKTEKLESSVECGCKSNLAEELEKRGIELLLAGGIGEGAIKKLKSHHIDVIPGLSGTLEEVIESWRTDNYSKQPKICTEHHNCSH